MWVKFNELLKTNEKLDFTESRKFKFSLAISVSLFSLLILIIFQPFGINNYNHESRITLEWLLYIFTIGVVAFAFFLIGEFLIRPFIIKKLTLLHLILWFIFEFIFVGSSLFLYYNFLGGFHDFTLEGWLIFILNTLFVTLIPFLGTIFFFNYGILKKEYSNILMLSKEKSNQNDLILISGDYKKDKIALPPENIVYIDSQDNYAALYYLFNFRKLCSPCLQ